ncbi:hypothetical protein F7Q97_17955, partial [Klebsiella michiganensis]
MNNKPGGGAMRLSGLPDLQTSCKPVARARRVKRRPREKSAEWGNLPEAMLRICPGLYDYSVRKNRPVLSDGGPDAVSGLRLSRLFRR